MPRFTGFPHTLSLFRQRKIRAHVLEIEELEGPLRPAERA
jgi:hypothetical protein